MNRVFHGRAWRAAVAASALCAMTSGMAHAAARHAAPAAPTPVMDVPTLLSQGPSLVGKRVTLTCYIASANMGGAACAAFRIDDLPGSVNWNGSVPLDGTSLEAASSEKAQQMCGDTGMRPQCKAEVTGIVYDPFGDMGVQGKRNFELRDARIRWLALPEKTTTKRR
ncbi:hypothetical protein [Novacetimonas maltaceti]|uniref:Uncharacterized protein n=1 Tax=Novacetimonas maltaceti TaxID=1203393 RepID=A0A2S3VZQ5_9PROT|nr:hypothetical protein [Novacetimonas maltaceti]POF62058.1 hypothetical protein KMAL_23390 [Novacetimonas maltaceti]